MKKYSTSLVIREMYITTTIRSLHTYQKVIIKIKNSDNEKKLDHSYIADGRVKWYSHSKKYFSGFL